MKASTCVAGSLIFTRRAPTDRVSCELFESSFLAASVLDATRDEPELATDFWASPAKARSRDYLFLGSQCEVFLGK